MGPGVVGKTAAPCSGVEWEGSLKWTVDATATIGVAVRSEGEEEVALMGAPIVCTPMGVAMGASVLSRSSEASAAPVNIYAPVCMDMGSAIGDALCASMESDEDNDVVDDGEKRSVSPPLPTLAAPAFSTEEGRLRVGNIGDWEKG